MGGLVAGLSGAGGNASAVGNYYNNAANNEVNATGSPAAAMFGQLQNAELRPQFQSAINQAASQAAAQGVTGSGAERANLGNVTAQNAATLAGAEAPLYSQALGQYGNIQSQGAGAQANAYNQAIQDFYSSLNSGMQGAGTFFGLQSMGQQPPGGNAYGPSTGYYEPGDSGGVSNTPYIP